MKHYTTLFNLNEKSAALAELNNKLIEDVIKKSIKYINTDISMIDYIIDGKQDEKQSISSLSSRDLNLLKSSLGSIQEKLDDIKKQDASKGVSESIEESINGFIESIDDYLLDKDSKATDSDGDVNMSNALPLDISFAAIKLLINELKHSLSLSGGEQLEPSVKRN